MEIYVGYYITGKKRIRLSKHDADECERNPLHEITHGGFCPECGGMVVTVEKTVEESMDIYDVPEEAGFLEDRFIFPEYISPEGEIVAISNYSKQTAAHLFHHGDGGAFCLDDIVKNELYESFMKQHHEDIRLLIQYVYDDVDIKFGIINYYM